MLKLSVYPSNEGKTLSSITNLLMLSTKQRKLCKQLEVGRSRLYRMAYAWTNSADIADDIVQETMIKAMHNVDKIKNTDALDSWLFRVLSNCFIDLCRKRREEIDIDEIILLEQNTPETIHSQDEMLAYVRAAIATLPYKHRQVITLVDIESFSYAEVATILDVPPGTIMSRLNRARHSLKKILNVTQKENHSKSTISKARLKVIK